MIKKKESKNCGKKKNNDRKKKQKKKTDTLSMTVNEFFYTFIEWLLYYANPWLGETILICNSHCIR